jgi:serine/threonine protein kinase/Flp pilus assembly protein TadD
MSTELQRTCPDCGGEFSGAMEFCPVCMLRKALADGVESGESSVSEDTVEPATLKEPARRFEHYELMTGEDGKPVELGRGAMGVTYKAFDVDLRCPVTLKVISERYLGDESTRLRFLREARAAASVRHPNVASVLHLGRTGSSYFYAMEFVEGETLESLIRRCGPLEVKLALEITGQVGAGLAAIHKQKLVHRDIKPSNIMVSVEEGSTVTAKIIDLGLAKLAPDAPAEAAISTPGAFAGTPEFASPEQFAGVGVDIRSDLYSLGAVLWEMLTGQAPFWGTSGEVMYQHQHAPLPLDQLEGVPQPVVVFLEVLLEKHPKRRFQSPAELLNALPKVTDAIKARRIITHQSLRAIADQSLGATGKANKVLTNFREVIAARRVWLILWLALMLVIGGGAILAVNIFFGPKGPAPQASRSSSPAVTAPERSIAVLPFESLSENKSDSYFADGVQDEILSNVARISQLKVISRTSVMRYRADASRDLRQIANALGVAKILEGTVRRAGNRVRITVELVDAGSDHAIWSESYDRDLIDIFAIQSEVAETIARKLTATLSPEEKKRIEAKPTENLEAYDLYLRAKELIAGYEISGIMPDLRALSDAINLLDQAVRLDPKFTLAYCESARALELTPERRALGEAAINSALRLQPDLPEVHLAYARHLSYGYGDQDYQRAREQLAIAKRGLANNAEVFRVEAYLDRRNGNWEKAIQNFNEAIALDPLNTLSINELAFTYTLVRQFSNAEKAYDRLIELLPDQPWLKVEKTFIPIFKNGDDGPARAAIEALPASMADDTRVLVQRLQVALTDRDWRKAKEIIEKFKGGEDIIQFAYGNWPVPVGCYSILIARLQGEDPGSNPNFAEVREQLNQKVQKLRSPESAKLLSMLAVVDVLLGKKQAAISEARRAAEILSISKDAMEGPQVAMNLAVVYAWTDEFDLAFETLAPLTKTPNGLYYAQLKLDRYLDPLRKDPRFEKLLAELAPKD